MLYYRTCKILHHCNNPSAREDRTHYILLCSCNIEIMISLTSLKILPNVEFNLLMELTLFPGVTVLVGLTQLVLIQ